MDEIINFYMEPLNFLKVRIFYPVLLKSLMNMKLFIIKIGR
ncbi:hypothetical protein SAMN02982990_04609 [Photorhabdus luminescens]|uniref:Uncharacterized protein n=1 Tax=Photorhabdus luminescens TaxID=29488 RepID=A0A1G5RLS5_PHOLU|nr:hypothetical protein SAMN02982990_04609 [Photorhabdus luminescens]